MKILFVGASSFGMNCLEAIYALDKIEVVGVISNEQKFSISYNKSGVTNILYKDFEETCIDKKIPFYRMKNNMKEPELETFIEKVKPEMAIVVGWYHIIPKNLLTKLPFAGLHASLLPDYSGGAPLVWAIINGETTTGISFFLFDEGIDNGDIIGQRTIEILPQDTIATLYNRIEILGKELLLEYIPKLSKNEVDFIKQDESKRRIFPQRNPTDGEINWNNSPYEIKNFIRAQTKPYPGAFTIINNKKITIWDADIDLHDIS